MGRSKERKRKRNKMTQAQRRRHQVSQRRQGRSWPDDVVEVVRRHYTELYSKGTPKIVEADYSIPTGWTSTGVAMWRSFVEATGGKEKAAATALITAALNKGGWIELCKNIEQEVIDKIANEHEMQLAQDAEAAVELSKVKSDILDNGFVDIDDSNGVDDLDLGVEDGTTEAREQLDGLQVDASGSVGSTEESQALEAGIVESGENGEEGGMAQAGDQRTKTEAL